MKYGIRMLITHWACKDGGDDYIGTQKEMEDLIETWKQEGILPNIRYTVIPYTQACGEFPCFPNPP